MRDYLTFFDDLSSNRLITPIWKEVLPIIDVELDKGEENDQYLILFTILFSLINDGNTCMSLNKETLFKKWDHKLNGTKTLLVELDKLEEAKFNDAVNKSHYAINNYLDKINENNLPTMIGKNRFFIVEKEYIYLRKTSVAKQKVLKNIDRLFIHQPTLINSTFDYKGIVKKNDDKPFKLSDGQENIVKQGITKNLIITGGPGTGKTTSLLFLLLGLMLNNEYDQIYLTAPSGKAASRMKDSISGQLSNLSDEFVDSHPELIKRIGELKSYTIHSLLSTDFDRGGFKYRETNQLNQKSIYVIDEASMIDICIFASLLEAIPDDARIFIMGDKDQLPSVDVGAVFGDLIINEKLRNNNNIAALTESIRFKEGTEIYNFAKAINNDDIPLPSLTLINPKEKIEKHGNRKEKPVYLYLNPPDSKPKEERKLVLDVVNTFSDAFYSDLQEKAMNLDIPQDDDSLKVFDELFDSTVKEASILCAENEGSRGVNTLNAYIKKKYIDHNKKTSIDNFFAGELMMVNKNNKLLDLYNGDSGILVTFKEDKTLYFMTEKKSELVRSEGYKQDKIFKIGKYMFYPFRMIARDEIDNAFAITIHKSQGSDYKNILVILPNKKGHPLLNRQIVYTAITRTKGDTYILSSMERLKEAKETVIIRDTNLN